MPYETEVKFLYVDHDGLRRKLLRLGAERLGRWFERNIVLDDAARTFEREGGLLRLRARGGKAVLTLKEPPEPGSRVKKCLETETSVGDFGSMEAILSRLGYREAFAYEKVREEWLLLGCEVCLDLLPFGAFLEIEGPEERLEECARALGLDMSQASTANYHRVHQQFREERGLPPRRSFVFEDGERRRLEQAG